MKKYTNSYNYGGRVLNWRVVVLSIGILWCAVTGYYSNMYNTYVAEKTQDVFMKPIVVVPDPTIEDKIKIYFPRSYKEVIKIAKYESGLGEKMNDMKDMSSLHHYNCFYKGHWTTRKDGTSYAVITNYTVLQKQTKGVISTSCQKKSDYTQAHSVDCFLLMKNYPGRKTCPEGITLDMHLKEVADMSRNGGLKIWSSYWTGAYLAIK
jgi:hypothetical protein